MSDQPQLIRRERTNLNQCTLRNLSSLDSPAAAAMGGGADMCCSSYDQLFVSEMGSSIPIISFTCQSSCLVGEHQQQSQQPKTFNYKNYYKLFGNYSNSIAISFILCDLFSDNFK